MELGISGSSFTGTAFPSVARQQHAIKAQRFNARVSRNAASKRSTNNSKSRSTSSNRQSKRVEKDANAPIAMKRATYWTLEVEEAYRVQGSGWRSIRDYRRIHGDPRRWENGFVKMTVHPKTGYFMYWSKERQCADSYLNKVKLYTYSDQPTVVTGAPTEVTPHKTPILTKSGPTSNTHVISTAASATLVRTATQETNPYQSIKQINSIAPVKQERLHQPDSLDLVM